MNPERIEVGDMVTFQLDSIGDYCYIDAVVLYTPYATNDAWVIKTKKGVVVYIQQYYSIELTKKG